MDFIDDLVMSYCINLSQDEPIILKKLNKETNQKILQSRMISGHYQGRFLSLISKIIKPKIILEIGTYTGYGTLCLSEGLSKYGQIHTIDVNEELVDFQKKYFELSKIKNQIFTYTGQAKNIIPKLNLNIDLVFLDADKANYPNYLEMLIPKLNNGAVLIADNVLWNGKVIKKEENNSDPDTQGIKLFNKIVKNDNRLENIILPIRDGLMICRKI